MKRRVRFFAMLPVIGFLSMIPKGFAGAEQQDHPEQSGTACHRALVTRSLFNHLETSLSKSSEHYLPGSFIRALLERRSAVLGLLEPIDSSSRGPFRWQLRASVVTERARLLESLYRSLRENGGVVRGNAMAPLSNEDLGSYLSRIAESIPDTRMRKAFMEMTVSQIENVPSLAAIFLAEFFVKYPNEFDTLGSIVDLASGQSTPERRAAIMASRLHELERRLERSEVTSALVPGAVLVVGVVVIGGFLVYELIIWKIAEAFAH